MVLFGFIKTNEFTDIFWTNPETSLQTNPRILRLLTDTDKLTHIEKYTRDDYYSYDGIISEVI